MQRRQSATATRQRGGARRSEAANSRLHTNSTRQTPQNQASKRVPIFDHRGRRVASVQYGALLISVHGSRHQLRRPPAWCILTSVLRDAERLGATTVRIKDLDADGLTYSAPLAAFWRDGFRLNRAHGDQRGLPLDFWRRSDAVAIQGALW